MLVATEIPNGLRIGHYFTDCQDQNGRQTIDPLTGIFPNVELPIPMSPGVHDQTFHLDTATRVIGFLLQTFGGDVFAQPRPPRWLLFAVHTQALL